MKRHRNAEQAGVLDILDGLERCHRDIRAHLDKLVALVCQLQTAGWDELLGSEAGEVIAFFSGPVRDHSYDEERLVFPTLLQCDDADVRRAAESLSEDHAWIELSWLDMEPELSAAAAGLRSHDLPALRVAAEAFASVAREHMDLEESVIYPNLRGRLQSGMLKSIGVDMAGRRAARLGD